MRVDSGVIAGTEISPLYDPMIAKLIVHGVDREHARRRMLRALDEFEIDGVTTLLGFHRRCSTHPCFVEGETCHGVVESEQLAERARSSREQADGTGGARTGRRRRARVTTVEVDGRRFEVTVPRPEPPYAELARRRRERGAPDGARRRQGRGREPDAGHGARGRGRGGRRGRGRSGDLHRRGDEDGERGAAHRAGVVTELSVAPGQPVEDRPGDLRRRRRPDG